jgi:hypothetical protein
VAKYKNLNTKENKSIHVLVGEIGTRGDSVLEYMALEEEKIISEWTVLGTDFIGSRLKPNYDLEASSDTKTKIHMYCC